MYIISSLYLDEVTSYLLSLMVSYFNYVQISSII